MIILVILLLAAISRLAVILLLAAILLRAVFYCWQTWTTSSTFVSLIQGVIEQFGLWRNVSFQYALKSGLRNENKSG